MDPAIYKNVNQKKKVKNMYRELTYVIIQISYFNDIRN